jgi:TPR repeat protein
MRCRILISTLIIVLAMGTAASGRAETVEDMLSRGDYANAVPALLKRADAGDVEAQSALGGLYLAGKGTPQDLTEGVKWSTKAANAGNVSAQFNLATLYTNGIGVSKDMTEAAAWLEKAARQGHAGAQELLGLRYYAGLGVGKDELAAWHWLLAAAKQGAPGAEFELAFAYSKGIGGRLDDPRCDELLKETGGDEAVARFKRQDLMKSLPGSPGPAPQIRIGTPKDAVPWYRKAAEQGFTLAQVNLGDLYLRGHGVTQDYEAALKWFRLAADSGSAKSGPFERGTLLALINLSTLYKYGWGVEKDDQEAAKLRQRAQAGGINEFARFKQLIALSRIDVLDPACGDDCMVTFTAGLGDSVYLAVRPRNEPNKQ